MHDLDKDGDCRTPMIEMFGWETKDYAGYLPRVCGPWGQPDSVMYEKYKTTWGTFTNEFSQKTAKALQDLQEFINGLPTDVVLPDSHGGAAGEANSMAGKWTKAGLGVYHDRLKSDLLTFWHPLFEKDIDESIELPILTPDMAATIASGGDFSYYDESETYNSLAQLDVKSLRIPEADYTKEDGFRKDGIGINQYKLNSGLTMSGPSNEM